MFGNDYPMNLNTTLARVYCVLVSFACACITPLATHAAPAAAQAAGNWIGSIGEIRVVFRISEGPEGRLVALADSPDQHAFDIPVNEVVCSGKTIRLNLKALRSVYEGSFTNESTIDGKLIQGKSEMPLLLKRVASVPQPPKRPQTPKRPYPYGEEAVSITNTTAGITLAGTLTLPRTKGPFAAVVLLTGSGPQDRDETVLSHRPFLVLSDYLTRQGFAVLRTDDRGVGESTGVFDGATILDFKTDALACVNYLRHRPEIKPGAVGVLGHSEGASVAILAAAESKDVAFVVSLAGVGIKGYDNMVLQDYLSVKQGGASEAEAAWVRDWVKRFYKVPLEVKDDAAAEAQLRAMYAAIRPEEKAAASRMGGITLDPKFAVTPGMRFGLAFDPVPFLSKVKCPVLALNGNKDVQVPALENLRGLETGLQTAGNQRVITKNLPNLNHLFQTVVPGGPTAYGEIEETMSPIALSAISDWLRTQL